MDSFSALALAELLDDGFAADDGRLVCDDAEAFVTDDAGQLTPRLLERIMSFMLFALPHEYPGQSLVIMPNPISRFCIDLRARSETPPDWFRNKKFQKYAGGFTVVVKTDLLSDLCIAKAYHESMRGGTWITAGLIDLLQGISRGARDVVQCFSFSLVEKSSGETAAACLGFASGGVYQDYTMCTPKRDHRSCGSLLSRIVCAILQQVGIAIWYWGYRMPYMDEYTAYGARAFSRREFNDVLRQTRGTRLLPFSAVRLPEFIALDIQVPTQTASS